MKYAVWLLVLAAWIPAHSFAAPLTLDQAWHRAEAAHPALKTAKAALSAAEGQAKDAGALLWNNPELSLDLSRRKIPQPGGDDERASEWGLGLSQALELAGQSRHRHEAAAQDLLAVREAVGEVNRQVQAEVTQRFLQVWSLQRRHAAEQASLRLIDEAAMAVRKRVAVGEESRLDGNLATVEAERAHNQLATVAEQLLQARSELAASLQLPPGELPEAIGELWTQCPTYTLEDLLDTAANRPQLRALAHRERSAHSRLALERASVYPDLTVGFAIMREGPDNAREEVSRIGLSMPLPLFRQNAGGIGSASRDLTHATIERETAGRDVAAQVRALWQQVESLKTRVQRYTMSVLPALDENKALSVKAFRAGEIGLLQLLLVNRQVLDANRDYLEALNQQLQTRVALEQAAGWEITPYIR